MNQSFIQELFAKRIGGSQFGIHDVSYKFEKIKRSKLLAIKNNPDLALIDMGIGEPDSPAEPQIIDTLYKEALNPFNRGYSDNGCHEFKEAAAHFMFQTFGVTLDPATQILHSIGSKSALSILPSCFINPTDIVFMTTPGYPVFGTHSNYLGGEVYNLPLTKANNFLPNLDAIPPTLLKRAKVLVLNYPNNPTGASATFEFYQNVISWAKAHDIIIIQDAAYAALTFENSKPLSILQIPGAIDVAIELHSLSKSFNMTGWRIGWVCGNSLIIKAYAHIKDNTDSGQFLPIQKAAIQALTQSQITQKTALKYSRRMDLLISILHKLGFNLTKPNAGFFLYCKIPKSITYNSHTINFSSAEDFSHWLIHNVLISTVPWDEVEPHIRFSVTWEAKNEIEEKVIVDETFNRLSKYRFIF